MGKVYIDGQWIDTEFVDPRKWRAHLRKKTAQDGRPRASLELSNIEFQHGPWRLVRAKAQNSNWKLALIEVLPGRDPRLKIRMDERDKSILILKQWKPCYRGNGTGSAYHRNVADGRALIERLKGMGIESALLLKAANYFDQPIG